MLKGVDIAYDNIPSMINYLISELAGEKNHDFECKNGD